MIRKGKSPAQRLSKARILLKSDVSEDGEGWSDSRIIEALETSVSMVYRVRKSIGGRRARGRLEPQKRRLRPPWRGFSTARRRPG